MMDLASFTVSTALSMHVMSEHTGSGFVQHAIYDTNYQTTGSIKPNAEWFLQQSRSGQKYHFINQQISSLSEKLDYIKSTFLLSEEQLADIVGVGRKTLFNWKNKASEPNKDKTQRVFELYMIAKNWKNAQYPITSFDLHTPILSGKTIQDMLHEFPLDSEKILFGGNRLAHQELGEDDLI
ncbi:MULTISPECIES: hypothetical protein [Acinetobacter]|uniref:hypothetical protein n=1 Tax=Acinetobacter TaxID=469 RepID=UPI0015D3EA86|nr:MULTISPECIES: hypothetical protein [Acinetobacter]